MSTALSVRPSGLNVAAHAGSVDEPSVAISRRVVVSQRVTVPSALLVAAVVLLGRRLTLVSGSAGCDINTGSLRSHTTTVRSKLMVASIGFARLATTLKTR